MCLAAQSVTHALTLLSAQRIEHKAWVFAGTHVNAWMQRHLEHCSRFSRAGPPNRTPMLPCWTDGGKI